MRVVAGVVVRGGRVLVARRGPATRNPGEWEFPGGKVEPGEDDATALARELAEELNLDVTVGDRITEVEAPHGTGRIHLLFYACTTQDDPDCTEHDAVRWLAADELPDLCWQAADRPAVGTIARWLRRMTPLAGP